MRLEQKIQSWRADIECLEHLKEDEEQQNKKQADQALLFGDKSSSGCHRRTETASHCDIQEEPALRGPC